MNHRPGSPVDEEGVEEGWLEEQVISPVWRLLPWTLPSSTGGRREVSLA